MTRTATGLIAVASVLMASCGGGDDSSARRDDTRTEQSTTTTTIPAEYRAVVDARGEAQSQYETARANPTNPENPVLRDYFTDVELLHVITGQVSGNAQNGNGIRTVYPDNSQHRFEIGSVTFSETDPNIAWLETCWVDDGVDEYIRTGAVADVHMDILEIPAIRTVQQTEEMRKEDGRWKVARTFVNSYQEGIAGCAVAEDYEQDHSQRSVTPELEQTITESRTAAEAAYVRYLTDPNYTGYAETWTLFQHDYYFADPGAGSDEYCPGDVTLIETGGAFSGEYEQFYLQDDARNPWRTNPYYRYDQPNIDQSPCYNDYELGQNGWSFSVRKDGRIFHPSTTSTVVVNSVQMQATDNPSVAYLTTCRTYNLAPTWQGEFPYRQGTVTALETMHRIDGAWKVSNRWRFTGTDSCN